jgi:hypothetical protein
VGFVKLFTTERPSGLAAACTLAHADAVGRLAVLSDPAYRPRLTQFQAEFVQQKSVQLQWARVQLQGTNGSMAKAIGVGQPSVVTGVKASGVPPRGRPV